MADPYHHSLSSVKKWGGEPDDYIAIHLWFDLDSKGSFADFRHRALRHHSLGIKWCVEHFGATIVLSTGKVVPTRWVAEQHVVEDLGRIPTPADWLRPIRGEPWMNRPRKLSRELEQEGTLPSVPPTREQLFTTG